MRKLATAAAAVVALLAGQAAAAIDTQAPRVGDRVGAKSEASSKFMGDPLWMFVGFAVIATLVVIHADDDDDDVPISA